MGGEVRGPPHPNHRATAREAVSIPPRPPPLLSDGTTVAGWESSSATKTCFSRRTEISGPGTGAASHAPDHYIPAGSDHSADHITPIEENTLLTTRQATAKEAAHQMLDYPPRLSFVQKGGHLEISDRLTLHDEMPRFKRGIAGIGIAGEILRVYIHTDLTPEVDIPDKLGGLRTEIIPSTGFSTRASARRSALSPVPCGVSTGHYQISAGTLGCLIDTSSGRCILSNNHVLANANTADIGDAIMQPGPSDATAESQPRRIAKLSDYEPLLFGGAPNHIDASPVTTPTHSRIRSTPCSTVSVLPSSLHDRHSDSEAIPWARTSRPGRLRRHRHRREGHSRLRQGRISTCRPAAPRTLGRYLSRLPRLCRPLTWLQDPFPPSLIAFRLTSAASAEHAPTDSTTSGRRVARSPSGRWPRRR